MDKVINFIESVLNGTFKSPYITILAGNFSFAFNKTDDGFEIIFDEPIKIEIKYLARLPSKIEKITIDKEYVYIKLNFVTIPINRKDLNNVLG